MESFIIHQSAKQYDWKGECFLSIKSFYRGEAHYKVSARQYHVSEDNYLILDNCTSYHLLIDTPIATESFCIFFDPVLVSEACKVFSSTDAYLLDNLDSKYQDLHFFERNYKHGDNLSLALKKMKVVHQTMKNDSFWIKESMHHIIAELLKNNASNIKSARELKPVRISTRHELYKRIYYARDYIDAAFHNDISINEISAVAMLSPSHLLRSFKMIFHLSPHQYIIFKRMELAKKLLTETQLPVSDIMLNIGYSSLSNFSWAFRQHYGLAPTDFRKK